ncbi:site-specific integrase [Amycolatopsis mongoliensis]|uniref:Site-specific integrase n=1 Tax=Amycolatopsis mongoliensis TaxID=715475 RepID=A0A9Y2JWF7_9PSEU|nr:site-specific integrase [Amycolatopsis sp. 4-36]WIY05438.1 site-specific integrase [Amycolatopsis sp. 4-36]
MPSTEKLPSGRWRGLYVDAEGKKQRVKGTFPRKSDAREAAVDAEAKAKRKAAASDGTLSASVTFREWYEQLSDERRFESDRGVVEASVMNKYVFPKWGDEPLNRIKRVQVNTWVKTDLKVRTGMSPGYVHLIYSAFRLVMTAAVDQEILDASPCVRIALPPLNRRKPKKFVTTERAAESRGNFGDDSGVYADMVDFGLEVGMRPNELAGLHVARIDRKGRKVHVVEVYVERSKKIRGYPKDGDVRTVPMTVRACEIYDSRIEGRDLKGGCGVEHYDGSKCTSALLFVNREGRPANQPALRRAMKRAGLDTGGYGLRRGYATRAVEGGADVMAVKRSMGHADLEELFGYVQETEQSEDRLRAALGDKKPLRAVGPRGTKRGTKRGNQPLPDAPNNGVTNAG